MARLKIEFRGAETLVSLARGETTVGRSNTCTIHLPDPQLAPIHFRALLRLAERYDEESFLRAATRAQDFRRFDAKAVERILEQQGAVPLDEPAPLGGLGAALLANVDSGSLDSFAALDSRPTTSPSDTEDSTHGS